jgi:hypothetical protein
MEVMNGKNREALIYEELKEHGLTGRKFEDDEEDE